MTKFARWVIFIIILITPLTLSLAKNTFADYLIRPIPDNSVISGQLSVINNQQSITDNRQPTTDNYIPSITFGDLLSSLPEEIEEKIKRKRNEQENISKIKSKKVQELLVKLYLDSQKELAEFQNQESRIKNQAKSNSQLTTHNLPAQAGLQPTTYNLQPTPYIPIPTLLAKIHSLVTTPTPPIHPRIESILADEKNSEFSYQNSAVSNQNSKILITDDRPLITNYIGELNENPKKTIYRIALLGDSMIDTLGKDLPHLQVLLTSTYPDYSFVLLNYGQGGTDLESGLYRLTNPTSYLDTEYPPLLSYKIDILIVESFAYNHWSGQFYDLDRQWLTIAKIIDTVEIHSPQTKIILAATIAPNTKTFGDGKLNWPDQLKWNSATITKAYLQNIVNFATSEGYPLADAYHPSLGRDGNGLAQYINQSDHLHPSNEGARLFSQKVFEVIRENGFIK